AAPGTLRFSAMHVRLRVHHLVSPALVNHAATTETYTLSLHDALPICIRPRLPTARRRPRARRTRPRPRRLQEEARRSRLPYRNGDRKSTRLNSSHSQISYAVFCLKKKKIQHYALLIGAGRKKPSPRGP